MVNLIPLHLDIILPIVFAGLAFIFWLRFGKDELVVETIEFYPPEGYNSAEIGFLYRGEAESIDVVSLLIYFADKGYIKISESEEKTLTINQKGFNITKIKEYDGKDPIERLFMDGLFKDTDEVTYNYLKDNFYKTLKKILNNINNSVNKEMIFEKSSLNKNIFIAGMIIAVFILINYNPIHAFNELDISPHGSVLDTSVKMFVAVLWPGIGFSVAIGGLIGTINMSRWLMFIWGISFGGLPWLFIVLPALRQDPLYSLAYLIGIISVAILLFFAKYMKKRTAYGNEILGKILGFKNFLETAEKPKLEMLVMENPAYFYNILPFTYVLGLSNKWIKGFENIVQKPPDWYEIYEGENTASFINSIDHTMTTVTSAMPSGSFLDAVFMKMNIKMRKFVEKHGSTDGGGGRSW